MDITLRNMKLSDTKGAPASSGEAATVVGEGTKKGGSKKESGQKRYRFHFHMGLCIGCPSCVTACGEEHGLPHRVQRRRVGELENFEDPEEELRYFLSSSCNHCLDPACKAGCPVGAYRITDMGMVEHLSRLCMGCGQCTENCPYGVPVLRPDTKVVTKCDLCTKRLGRGEDPACVEACPSGAIRLEKVAPEKIEATLSDVGAGPELPPPELTRSSTKITPPGRVSLSSLKRSFRPSLLAQPPHISLIFLTIFSQMAAGFSLFYYLPALLFSLVHGSYASAPVPEAALFRLSPPLWVAPFLSPALMGAGLLASLFHPGRPLRIFRVYRGLKSSLISREGGLFFVALSLWSLSASSVLLRSSGDGFASNLSLTRWELLTGVAGSLFAFWGVWTAARIYRVYSRPLWNSAASVAIFLLTALLTGFSLHLWMGSPRGEAGLSSSLLLFIGTTLWMAWNLGAPARSRRGADELKGGERVRKELFSRFSLVRWILGGAALLLAAALFVGTITGGARGASATGAGALLREGAPLLSGSLFLALLAHAWLDRFLFFTLAIPRTIPGFSTVTLGKRKGKKVGAVRSGEGKDPTPGDGERDPESGTETEEKETDPG